MQYKYLYLDDYRPAPFEQLLNDLAKEGFKIIVATSRYIILAKTDNPSERPTKVF